MFTSKSKKLTDLSQVFLVPTNATHRQYEALRAFFVEGIPSAEVARSFGYTPGSFRVLVHQFRQNPRRDFFLTPAKGPHSAPKADPLRDRVIALRKQNLSIYDSSRNLAHEGHPLSPVAVAQILKDEGFARLPRRADDERPLGSRPTTADVADVRQLNLSSSSSLFVLTRINQSGRLDGKMEVGSKLHLDPERRPSCSPYPKPLCHCCARSPGLACCRRPSACSL